MKTITLHIDEEIYRNLTAEVKLRDFTDGSVPPPTNIESAMIGILKKIKAGKTEVTLARKGKPCR